MPMGLARPKSTTAKTVLLMHHRLGFLHAQHRDRIRCESCIEQECGAVVDEGVAVQRLF
jgi:hypothetical protein